MAPTARQPLMSAAGSWAEHHPQHPFVLVDEFEEAVRHLETLPLLGVPAAGTSVPDLRRILLVRSRHHVDYAVDASERVVELLAVWYSGRGSLPEL